jgi:hypothetical protein
MTDLGLAPGWANIVAEHLYHKKSEELDGKAPERIDMSPHAPECEISSCIVTSFLLLSLG